MIVWSLMQKLYEQAKEQERLRERHEELGEPLPPVDLSWWNEKSNGPTV